MSFSVGTVEATIGANMKPFEKAMGKVRSLGMKMTASVTAPLLGAGGLALKTAADYEKLRVSMDTLNGSAEEGARNFERLKTFSAETPFQLKDLASAQNMLQGFGLEADEAFESIKMIGDISAVSGGSIEGIGVAFGQAAAEGKLMSRDIRQLINQGVPAIKLLADTMGVAESEVFDLASQGEISFEILQQSFKDATSEGGMFADGMKKQSQTLGGVFSTLKDNVSLALGEIGQSLNDTFNLTELVKTVTSGIKSLTARFANLSKQTKGIIFTIAGLLAAGGPIMIAISAMLPAISAIGTAFAALVSPIGLAVAAVAGLAAGVLYLWDNWAAVKERISDWGWWKNTLVSMAQFLIEYSPISLLIKQVNAMLRFMGAAEIPNLFEAMAGQLDGLKGETKEYEHDFGSFMDAVKNGVNALTEINLGNIFSFDTGIDTEPIKRVGVEASKVSTSVSSANTQLNLAKVNTNGLVNPIELARQKYQQLYETNNRVRQSSKFAMDVSNQFTNSFGQGMANVIVQGEKLVDTLKNIGKLLLSSVIQKGLSVLLSGGLGGSGFFGSGGGLFGKIFGVNDAMITSAGDVIKMHPNDKMFAMKDGRQPSGGGGISESKLSNAFEKALNRQLSKLGPDELFALTQKGRLNY